jgi:carbon storage regulator CsrA
MLGLKRRKGEIIRIGDQISLKVLGIAAQKARLRITAVVDEAKPPFELTVMAHRGDTQMIGDHIQVVVLEIEETEVSIGIQAPPNVPIDRQEIWLRKQASKVTT